MPIGKAQGLFRPERPGRRAVHHRHAAAQRHRHPAHRPRARQYAAGHPHPPRADAGQGRAVGGRHRPCRHRDPDGGRAPARRASRRSAPISAATNSSSKVWEWKAESGGADHPPAAPPRRVVRLGERALHDGRGLFEGRHSRCSSSFTSAACSIATSGWSIGTRSFQTAISDLEVETREVQGKFWHLRYPLADGSGRDLGRDHAAGDDARRHGGRGASRRRALHGAGRQAAQACRSPAG